MISKQTISDYYCTYNGELYTYLLRLSHDSDLSEDLLQECFERLIDYSMTREIEVNTLRAFLYRTAHNLFVNHCVKQSKRATSDIDVHAEILGSEDRTHEELVAGEMENRVTCFLESLPAEERSMFVMHRELGKTYDEIGEAVGVSSRTVRRRMKEVIDELAEILSQEGFLNDGGYEHRLSEETL